MCCWPRGVAPLGRVRHRTRPARQGVHECARPPPSTPARRGRCWDGFQRVPARHFQGLSTSFSLSPSSLPRPPPSRVAGTACLAPRVLIGGPLSSSSPPLRAATPMRVRHSDGDGFPVPNKREPATAAADNASLSARGRGPSRPPLHTHRVRAPLWTGTWSATEVQSVAVVGGGMEATQQIIAPWPWGMIISMIPQ